LGYGFQIIEEEVHVHDTDQRMVDEILGFVRFNEPGMGEILIGGSSLTWSRYQKERRGVPIITCAFVLSWELAGRTIRVLKQSRKCRWLSWRCLR
jgi:hypothetical protein